MAFKNKSANNKWLHTNDSTDENMAPKTQTSSQCSPKLLLHPPQSCIQPKYLHLTRNLKTLPTWKRRSIYKPTSFGGIPCLRLSFFYNLCTRHPAIGLMTIPYYLLFSLPTSKNKQLSRQGAGIGTSNWVVKATVQVSAVFNVSWIQPGGKSTA